MNSLPANLDVEGARLPATYVTARHALAECARIDVCKQWADRAQALASYARQASDNDLRKMCDRIQARAILRCGELLKEIPPDPGGRPPKTQDGTVPSLTREQAATEAGLSERQRKTALRVANVPKAEFEAAVESDNPPTVTELAERGRKRRPAPADYLGGRDPEDYSQATHLLGLFVRFNGEADEIDLAAAKRGLWPAEAEKLVAGILKASQWIAKLEEQIGVGNGL